MANLSPTEARNLLTELEQITQRANPTSTTPPRGLTILTGVLLGVGFGMILMNSVWGLLLALLTMIPVLYLEYTKKRRVRYAMKQPVTPDPPFSWKLFLIYVAVYAACFIALNALPQGNIAVATGLAVVIAALTIGGITWYWKKGQPA